MSTPSEQNSIKAIMLGDGAVGKTCLVYRFYDSPFPGEYIPTVFDSTSKNVQYKNQSILLSILDTGGGEDYHRLRPLSYPQTDVFILNFSVVSKESLNRIPTYWIPEIQYHCPNTPYIILGTKCDLFNSDDPRFEGKILKPEEILEVVQSTSALGYLQTSALEDINIRQALDLIIEIGYNHLVETTRPCRSRFRCTLL